MTDLTSEMREKITEHYLRLAIQDGLDDSDTWPVLLFIAGPKFDEYVELVRRDAESARLDGRVNGWLTSNAFIDAECDDKYRGLWFAVAKHLGYA